MVVELQFLDERKIRFSFGKFSMQSTLIMGDE
jgi:hypothetical protein